MKDYQPLHIQRTLEAARQDVWDAVTQPEKFKQWFMPAPYSIGACELDVRPGGQLRVDTVAPDGSIQPMTGEYKVVEAPAKLVMTGSPLDADGNQLFEVQHTMLFSETDDGGTMLDITSEVLSAGPDAEQYLTGMEPGLSQALDQLGELVRR